MLFLSFQMVIQPSKNSDHYLTHGSHPCLLVSEVPNDQTPSLFARLQNLELNTCVSDLNLHLHIYLPVPVQEKKRKRLPSYLTMGGM